MSRARVLAAAAALAVAFLPGTAAVASSAPGTGTTSSGLDRVELPVGWQPEGITSGPGGRFYVGSLADGALYAGDVRTGEGSVLLAGEPGRRLVGLFYDRRSGLVWAAGALNGEGRVWAVDGWTGAVQAEIAVPGTGFLNDLVATGTDVWVTDSFGDQLVRIPVRGGLPTGAAVLVPLQDPWPVVGAFRANGIRALNDGSLVIVHSAAGLWRYVPATGRVQPIPVAGSPAVVSGDGLELRGDTLYVVRGTGGQDVTVVELHRAGGAWSGRVTGLLTSSDVDVPTTGTLAQGSFWVVNARFGNPDPASATYWVTRLDLAD